LQQQHQNLARQNRAQFASVNHGRPSVTASARPGQFQSGRRAGGGQQVVPRGPNRTPQVNASRGSRPGNPPSNRNVERPQGRTPNVESRQAHTQASRAATPNRNAGVAHPPAQQRKSNPPEERKEKGREPAPHR
jgi:hypothetical protein